MAKRTAIAEDIRRQFGKNMLNATEVADYLGYKRAESARPFLAGLDCYETGGGQKKYLAIDIARKLDERKGNT